MRLHLNSMIIQLQRMHAVSDAEILAYAAQAGMDEAAVHAPGAGLSIIDAIVAAR